MPNQKSPNNNIQSEQPAVPAWMLEKSPSRVGRSSGTGFIAKTLRSFSEVFESEFRAERYASANKLLQCLDPRVKVIVLFGFMVFSAFSSSIVILLLLALIALLYAKLSGLDMKDYLRRVWAYIPLLVFILSLPGASSLFTKGTPLLIILPPGVLELHDGLYFTAPGVMMAVRLALRPGISLSFAFLLLLTTRWSQITEALARMHLPLMIVSVLNMAYRYIFIIAGMANSMMEARYLRTVGKLSAADNRRFMGHSAANLFIKSHFLSEEIYDAMVCRGFTGRPVSIETEKMQLSDILFIVNNAVILLLLIAGELLF